MNVTVENRNGLVISSRPVGIDDRNGVRILLDDLGQGDLHVISEIDLLIVESDLNGRAAFRRGNRQSLDENVRDRQDDEGR